MTMPSRSPWEEHPHLTKALDSDAAEEIASFHNLNSNIQRTQERHPQIEQNQESDFEFLKKLADRNHYELFVDEKRTLHFRKPNDAASAVVRLLWGQGLISFKPEANLAGQISKVEVYGWDPKKKERSLARPRPARIRQGCQGAQAGEQLRTFIKDPSNSFCGCIAGLQQGRGEKRANAALNERAKQFLTGDAAIGLPEISRHQRPVRQSRRAVLEDLLRSAVDPQDRRQWLSHALQGQETALNMISNISRETDHNPGMIKGRCNRDRHPEQGPDNLPRQVRFPGTTSRPRLLGSAHADGRSRSGLVCVIPEVDDEVLIAFEREDMRFPIVLAGSGARDKPPRFNGDSKNDKRILQSRKKHYLLFDDGAKGVVSSFTGRKVTFTDDGITMDDGQDNSVKIDNRLDDHRSQGRPQDQGCTITVRQPARLTSRRPVRQRARLAGQHQLKRRMRWDNRQAHWRSDQSRHPLAPGPLPDRAYHRTAGLACLIDTHACPLTDVLKPHGWPGDGRQPDRPDRWHVRCPPEVMIVEVGAPNAIAAGAASMMIG